MTSLAEAPYAFGSTHAEAVTFSDQDWASHLGRGPYLIAQRDGRDVGIVRLASGNEETIWWLYSLWIAPEARGTELITMLLEVAEETARDQGANILRLDVARGNTRAIAAYLRQGYRALSNEADADDLEIVFSKNL